MFKTLQEIEDSLIASGLSPEGAKFIAERAKPTIILQTAPVNGEDELAIGATKIGGCPDLPTGMAWPMRPSYPNGDEMRKEHLKTAEQCLEYDWMPAEERERCRREMLEMADAVTRDAPLAFIAQIDLAALSAARTLDPDLPSEGRLLLFYDLDELPWGSRPGDIAGARLIFDTSPVSALTRQAPPDSLDDTQIEPLHCKFEPTFAPENANPEYFEKLEGKNIVAMMRWRDGLGALSTHRVGGCPTEIQGDMAAQCVLVSNGIDVENRTVHAKAMDQAREREDWVFLFQIASDEDNDMMWADSGMLYLWIHRDDLRARRFEMARLILQSH